MVVYEDPGTLKELLQGIVGKPRKFLVLRISGVAKEDALAMVSSDRWGFASWIRNSLFQSVHKRIKHWQAEFKSEAIKMLRRSNQLLAALFEKDVIEKLIGEVESGDYHLIKTQLAKEVYAKLINDLDSIPAVQHNSWEQTIERLYAGGSNDNREAERIKDKEHQESLNEVASLQGNIQDTKKEPSSGVFTIQEETDKEDEGEIDERQE